MIDQASVFAERYKGNPQVLQATVLGQGNIPGLDPYTALNALKLIKESNMMAMAGRAQQPTSSPSIVAETLAPAPSPQGLGAMVPNTMGQMPPGAPQGLAAMAPQQRAPQQAPVMQRSGGLAGMPTPEENYAEGGIIAFKDRGLVPAYAGSSDGAVAYAGTPAVSANPFADNTEGENLSERERLLALLDEIEDGDGDPTAFAAANKLGLGVARRIASRDLRDLSPQERKTMYAEEYKRITDAAGPSPYAGMRADIAEQGKERAANLEFAKGEALLQAASDVLEGNNAMRGLAKGGARFAKVYGEAQRADKAVKRSMSQMEFHIADAERKERMGNSRAAAAAVESARKDRRDLNKAELDSDIALGRLATEMGKVNKPARPAGAGGSKEPKLNEQLSAAEIAYEMDPSEKNRQQVVAIRRAVDRVKTTESGAGKLGAQNTQIFVGAAKDASAEARKLLNQDPVMRSNDPVAKNKRYRELYAEAIQSKFPSTPLSDLLANMPAEELPAGGRAPAPAASAKALPMPATQAELKTNQLYNTSQGPAVWNGTKFVAQ
jgi:hypothetical protein